MRYSVFLTLLFFSCRAGEKCPDSNVKVYKAIVTNQGQINQEKNYVTQFKEDVFSNLCDSNISGNAIYISEERDFGNSIDGLLYFENSRRVIPFCREQNEKTIKIDKACTNNELTAILSKVKENFLVESSLLKQKYDSLGLNDAPILELTYIDTYRKTTRTLKFQYTYEWIIKRNQNLRH